MLKSTSLYTYKGMRGVKTIHYCYLMRLLGEVLNKEILSIVNVLFLAVNITFLKQ